MVARLQHGPLCVALVLALTPGRSQASPPTDSSASETSTTHGLLILDGSAVGVEVVIRDGEGRERSLGRVPTTIEVPPGEYELIVDEPGYLPWHSSISISAEQETRVSVEPELIEQALLIAEAVTEPSVGAELRVDGDEFCTLPCRGPIRPGTHRVEIRKRKMKPLTFEVEAKQADRIELDVALERATSRAPAIITGSVALGCLGTALFFTIRADRMRRSLAADLADHVQYDGKDSRIDVGRRDAVIGSAMYGVTAIAVGLTIYYLLRQPGRPSRIEKRRESMANTPWQLAPGLSPSGVGLFGEVRF